jgi:purine-nucleoside phosphorylase
MSTVPEAIAASHCGLPVLGLSLITNMAAGMAGKRLSGEEVIEIADRRGPVFQTFVLGIVEAM